MESTESCPARDIAQSVVERPPDRQKDQSFRRGRAFYHCLKVINVLMAHIARNNRDIMISKTELRRARGKGFRGRLVRRFAVSGDC